MQIGPNSQNARSLLLGIDHERIHGPLDVTRLGVLLAGYVVGVSRGWDLRCGGSLMRHGGSTWESHVVGYVSDQSPGKSGLKRNADDE